MSKRWPPILWVIMAAGLLLRLAFIGRKSLSFFEARSFSFAENYATLSAIMNLRGAEGAVHPLLLRVFIYAGGGEAALRLLSAAASVGIIYLVWLLGRRLLGERPGLAAAALAALMPVQVFFAQDATPYALGAFLVLGSVWAFIRFLDAEPEEGEGENAAISARWRAWALWTLAALYTLHLALAVLAGLAVWAAFRLGSDSGRELKRLRIWRRGLGRLLLYYLPGLAYLVLQLLNNLLAPAVSRVVMPQGLEAPMGRFAALVFGPSAVYASGTLFPALLILAVIVLISLPVVSMLNPDPDEPDAETDNWDEPEGDQAARAAAANQPPLMAWASALAAAWIIAALAACSAGLGLMALVSPVICLLLAAAVRGRRRLGLVLVAGWGLIFLGVGVLGYLPVYKDYDWRGAAARLHGMGPNPGVLYGVAVLGIDDPYTPRYYLDSDRFELFLAERTDPSRHDRYLTVRDGLWELIPRPHDLTFFMLQQERFALLAPAGPDQDHAFPRQLRSGIVPEFDEAVGNLAITPFIQYVEPDPGPMIRAVLTHSATPWDGYSLLLHLPPERFELAPELIMLLADEFRDLGAEPRAQDCWEIVLDLLDQEGHGSAMSAGARARIEVQARTRLVESYMQAGYPVLAEEQLGRLERLAPESPDLDRLRQLTTP